ncbi:flagellar protein FlaG [Brevibacillus sp. B_LB10_24]|uniref:flagellar protein FlaG n=1 Tax=Brevibacillus sp. B_LB10_24 TaxID=3380645 RepID=UPI0038BAF8A5
MDIHSVNQTGKISSSYSSERPIAPTSGEPGGPFQEVSRESSPEGSSSKREVEKAVDSLNKWIQSGNTHLKFTLHEKLNEYYVEIVDDQTQEVVREVPPKKILDMVAKMHEMIGILVDEKR